MHKRGQILRLLALILALMPLTGCLFEPPACSDAEVAKTLKTIVLEQSAKETAFFADSNKNRKLLKDYLAGLRFGLDGIVSNGYKRDAKARQCHATLTIQNASKALTTEIDYKVQTTEGGNDRFMVWLDQGGNIAAALASEQTWLVANYANAGEWSGTYRCGGVEGATSGPRGPFERQVSMQIKQGNSGKIERTTQAGGVEALQVDLDSGIAAGEGANSADDKWTVKLEGKTKDYEYDAKGVIKALDGELLRQCELHLKLTPLQNLPTS